jgi:hypothetical protein
MTSHTPIYLVTPVGKNVLGYCEMLSEWLRPRTNQQACILDSVKARSALIRALIERPAPTSRRVY